MYRFVMAIRPDALPTDAAALTEMVLALDAENEKLRVAMQTLKEMIFGKRSERLAALVAEQLRSNWTISRPALRRLCLRTTMRLR
jgi:transposase